MTLYNQIITGTTPEPPKPTIEEDALSAQERINWVQSPGTKTLIRNLAADINSLEAQARALAVNYSAAQEHLKIVALLQQADTLRKLIDKYGKLK